MRNLSMINTALASGFLAGSVAAAEPEKISPHPYYRPNVSVSVAHGCDKLVGNNCQGTSGRIEWKLKPVNGFGPVRFGIEAFRERIGHAFLSERFDKRDVSGGVQLDWNILAEGQRLTYDQGFRLPYNANAELGFYVGKVRANLTGTASADLTIHPKTITVPDIKIDGFEIPSFVFDYEGDHFSGSKSWSKKDASADGGIRGALGWSLPFIGRTRVGVGGFGELSLLRTHYGVGTGVFYSSSPDDKLGSQPNAVCNGRLESSARLAISFGVCASRYARDALIDAKMRKAASLSAKIDGAVGELNEGLQKAGDYLPALDGRSVAPPRYTVAQVSDAFGFRHDYRDVRLAFVLSAEARVWNDMTVSASYRHLKDHSQLAVTLRRDF